MDLTYVQMECSPITSVNIDVLSVGFFLFLTFILMQRTL